MKETKIKKSNNEKEYVNDLTEIKLTIEIMKKQIQKLEDKLQVNRQTISEEDWKEMMAMSNNRKK